MPKRVRDTAGTRAAIEAEAEVEVEVEVEPAEGEWDEAERIAAQLAGEPPTTPTFGGVAKMLVGEAEAGEEEAVIVTVRVVDEAGEEVPVVTGPALTAANPPGLSESGSSEDALERVRKAGRARRRASIKLEDATSALQAAVRDAREHGSLRELAKEAGVSYDTIDRWTK